MDTLDFEFKVIGLSETALNNFSINYHINNYTCEVNIRDNRKGGGVSLYVHNTFQYKLLTDLQLGGVVNSVFVELLKSTTRTKQNILCRCVWCTVKRTQEKRHRKKGHGKKSTGKMGTGKKGTSEKLGKKGTKQKNMFICRLLL